MSHGGVQTQRGPGAAAGVSALCPFLVAGALLQAISAGPLVPTGHFLCFLQEAEGELFKMQVRSDFSETWPRILPNLALPKNLAFCFLPVTQALW